jgi:hypothetical protein
MMGVIPLEGKAQVILVPSRKHQRHLDCVPGPNHCQGTERSLLNLV